MKRILFIVLGIAKWFAADAQEPLVDRNTKISFFSAAPIENIAASSSQAFSAIDSKKKTVYFKVPIKSFQFKKALMQEHFNENYLESDKYPYAEFSGQLVADSNWTKAGAHTVTVQGTLSLHGISHPYKVSAVITAGPESIQATCSFKVKLEDHKIERPRLVFQNIAEIIDVKVSALYKTSGK